MRQGSALKGGALAIHVVLLTTCWESARPSSRCGALHRFGVPNRP